MSIQPSVRPCVPNHQQTFQWLLLVQWTIIFRPARELNLRPSTFCADTLTTELQGWDDSSRRNFITQLVIVLLPTQRLCYNGSQILMLSRPAWRSLKVPEQLTRTSQCLFLRCEKVPLQFPLPPTPRVWNFSHFLKWLIEVCVKLALTNIKIESSKKFWTNQTNSWMNGNKHFLSFCWSQKSQKGVNYNP